MAREDPLDCRSTTLPKASLHQSTWGEQRRSPRRVRRRKTFPPSLLLAPSRLCRESEARRHPRLAVFVANIAAEARGHRQDDPECIKQTYAEIYPTFLEDKDMLEAQQTRIDLDPSRQLIAIPSDKALSYARRALRDMIEADKALTRVAAE